MNEIIEVISDKNFHEWILMGLDLWPDHTEDELREIFLDSLKYKKEKTFLYRVSDEYVGFINVSIRNDYVEGSHSSPVGYVEGIYVKPHFRKKGIANNLLKKAEEWAHDMGCVQMGSDIELNNTISYDFHKKIGFQEANRIICFIKDI